MLRIDRILLLHQILTNRRTPVSRKKLEERMECSTSTVKRSLEILRDYLQAPVKYDPGRNGYYYDKADNEQFELPGLWFNPSEIHALLTTHQLLSRVQPGLLEPHITPLLDRINRILEQRKTGASEVAKRIRILQMSPRLTDIDVFRKIADALIRRKRIKMLYHGRERDSTTERWVSPQRLTYYRDHWYLDGWCHLRQGLRSFALDRIGITYIGESAKEIPEQQLDAHYGDAYGIFAGKAKYTAIIRFSSSAARWVADEQWHPRQKSTVNRDGSCTLAIPYSDYRELIMDILKYGPEAEVIQPKALREEIVKRLKDTLNRYNPAKTE